MFLISPLSVAEAGCTSSNEALLQSWSTGLYSVMHCISCHMCFRFQSAGFLCTLSPFDGLGQFSSLCSDKKRGSNDDPLS